MKFRHFAALLLVGLILLACAFTDIPWTLAGTTLSRFRGESPGALEQPTDETEIPCGPWTGPLTPVPGAPALLVSASWDEREGPAQARVLAIVKRQPLPALRCLFCCDETSGEPFVHSPARVDVHSLHFNFPWATADVLCSPPNIDNCSTPQGVTLVPAEDPVPTSTLGPRLNFSSQPETAGLSFTPFYPGARGPLSQEMNFTHQFGVCISTLFGGYDNVLQFAQAVEFYRLMGASIVNVYKSDCGPTLARLLAHYEAAGIVEMVPWPIGRHLRPSRGWNPEDDPGDVHYYGQTAALNDCLYRRMHDTRYLAMTDVDEVIVPLQHEDWPAMMKALVSRYGVSVFHFTNYVFPHPAAPDANQYAAPYAHWRGVPGHNILTHVRHEPPTVYSTKMMLEARRVIRVSVHSVLHSLRGQAFVPSDVARMFHFRGPMQPELSKNLTYDATLWRHNTSLVANVDAALRAAGLLP